MIRSRDHEFIENPPDTTVIWHYMSLPKFMSMTQRRELYFATLDQLIRTRDEREASIRSSLFRDTDRTTNELLEAIKLTEDYHKPRYRVMCWHISPKVSTKMWEPYKEGKDSVGIAIQSTIGRLKQSLRLEEYAEGRVRTGSVLYTDEALEIGSNPIPVTHEVTHFIKATSFEHENEYRVVINPATEQLYFPVDLEILVKKIVCSPFIENWIYETIRDYVGNHFTVMLEQSPPQSG